jgi:glutamyl-Q tRNA(Asp) synthetase
MIVTRFAPSPTGYLHLGHALAAITAFESAASAHGRFLLRIEDLDIQRARAEFETAIYDDLHWLGLSWLSPVLRQSERFQSYRVACDRLYEEELLYPCFCTRSEILSEVARASQAPHGPEGPLYPGTCKRLSLKQRVKQMASGAPYALRLNGAKAKDRIGPLCFEERGRGPGGEYGSIVVDPLLFGDIVIARKDLPASYHLAVVIDDAHQGVTLVTRGNDLFAATHVQRVLQTLLGLPVPVYAHHGLVIDEQGRKLSKRDKASSLRELRASSVTAEEVRRRLASASGRP